MLRKDLIDIILDNPMSVNALARQVRKRPAEVEADLQHLFKSLKHSDLLRDVHPARCRKCGFEFGPDKLHKPSRCPECNATWLEEPRIGLKRRES